MCLVELLGNGGKGGESDTVTSFLLQGPIADFFFFFSLVSHTTVKYNS